jgi:hypothetical protein
MRKTLLFLLAIIFIPQTVLATSWYLDNAATGSNNGTSWTNAWHHPEHIVWGSSGVKAGDTLFISGGTTSKTYIVDRDQWLSVDAGGTSDANRIIIRIGQDSGHNGTAIIEMGGNRVLNGAGGYNQAIRLNGHNWITIDGEYGGARHITIQNVKLIGPYDSSYGNIAIHSAGGVGITIKGVTISTSDTGIYYTSNSDPGSPYFALEVNNCSITDIRSQTAIYCVAAGIAPRYDVVSIHNSTISVNHTTGADWDGPDGIQVGHGLTFYNNTIYAVSDTDNSKTYGWNGISGCLIADCPPGSGNWWQHQDLIQYGGRNIKVYNNYMADGANSAMSVDRYEQYDDGFLRIYNNVIQYSYQRGTQPLQIGFNSGNPTLITDVLIVNNTFADCSGYIVGQGVDCATGVTLNAYRFQNNIMVNATAENVGCWAAGCVTTGVITGYNVTFPGSWGTNEVAVGGESCWYQPATISHSLPAFSPTAYTGPYSLTNTGFRLSASDTVARGTGVNLTSLCTSLSEPALCMDKDGVARPASGAWDIGAYQYGAGEPDTDPPVMSNPLPSGQQTCSTGCLETPFIDHSTGINDWRNMGDTDARRYLGFAYTPTNDLSICKVTWQPRLLGGSLDGKTFYTEIWDGSGGTTLPANPITNGSATVSCTGSSCAWGTGTAVDFTWTSNYPQISSGTQYYFTMSPHGTDASNYSGLNTNTNATGYTFIRWTSTKTVDTTDSNEIEYVKVYNYQASNAIPITLELTTDEAATCKYSTSDVSYDSMAYTYSSTGGTTHTQALTGSCGSSYVYYSRCMDGSNNKDTSSATTSFSIAGGTTPITPVSGVHIKGGGVNY